MTANVSISAAEPSTYRLTREQVMRFHDEGYVGPLTLCSPEEMAAIADELERDVFCTQGPCDHSSSQSRHLDKRVVWDICSHPAIVEALASIWGDDLVLWRSNFFNKGPGAKEIPWHQDYNYWPIEPAINITAWVAVDEVTEENSCVHIIPGSHKKILRHVKAGEDKAFNEEAEAAYDPSNAVSMILKPGQFFLFTERTLHQSNANHSDMNRRGLAVRMTLPQVRVYNEQLFPKHYCMMLKGEDRLQFNRYQAPPES